MTMPSAAKVITIGPRLCPVATSINFVMAYPSPMPRIIAKNMPPANDPIQAQRNPIAMPPIMAVKSPVNV